MNLSYRDAGLQDLAAIVAIYNSTVASRMVTADTETVSLESKLPWFHAHKPGHRPLWVVENDQKQIVGWISFERFKERPAYFATAELSIYLHEDHRGKGLGKAILQHAIDSAPALGIKNLVGFIFSHNTPSLKLFRSLGFHDWGEFPNVAIVDDVERSVSVVGRKVMSDQ
jgi:L-amino acid N-acyltransferase YncA